MIDTLVIKESVAETYRRLGFAVVAAAPDAGVLRGSGAVVTLAEGPMSGRVLVAESEQYISLEPEDDANEYPVSKMGAVAVARQAFLDADWWRDAQAAYAARPSGQARPAFRAAAAALVPAAEGRETVVFDTVDVLALLRSLRVAREMKLRARYVAAGDEYRLLPEVVAARPDLILRVAFPQPDKLDREEEWLDVPLSRLRTYDRAPSNPKWLRDAGLEFSFTTAGLEDVKDFDKRVRAALERGLSADDALAALTTIPARQLGLADRLGTIASGKIANLVVETGEPFAEKSRVSEIWIDGNRFESKQKKEAPATETAAAPAESPKPDRRSSPAREAGPVAAPSAVVVRGATVWTQGTAGILEEADVLVVGGKISAVGKGLAAPAGALEIDGRGKHVTPGIVDAHSHTAVDGDVNEGS
ncbi:MAG TPA: amidohydrolase family protein, partial [Thermoanaerobaculia bacterium]